MNASVKHPRPRRFDIWLIRLDPTLGREIKKTRPCVVVSPDELSALSTVIVAPMTSKGFLLPSRVPCEFAGTQGLILLDQLRTVDRVRLIKKKGRLEESVQRQLSATLQEMFAW